MRDENHTSYQHGRKNNSAKLRDTTVALAVDVGGIRMKNPVTVASGTFASGREYADFVDISYLGAITTKGTSFEAWEGNDVPRIAETPSGMLNSIGLQNPGVAHLVATDLPWLAAQKAQTIINVSGHSAEEYRLVIEYIEQHLEQSNSLMFKQEATGKKRKYQSDSQNTTIHEDKSNKKPFRNNFHDSSDTQSSVCTLAESVAGYEINVSCPNVDAGGMTFGCEAKALQSVIRACRAATDRPLIVKLTPNVTNIADIARAAVDAGADALSLINTLLGLAIDAKARKPVLARGVGGLSGPCVKPIALRMVAEVFRAVDVPIIGMGGICTGQDAVEFMLAGATGVAVGTANFMNPYATIEVLNGIIDFCEQEGIEDVQSLIGALKW